MNSTKEITDYIEYVEKNPHEVAPDVRLLIKNIVKPTLKSDDIYFDKKTFKKCIRYCEKWYYPLFPYQKFIYAFVFMYDKENPDEVAFREIFQMMARGNGKDGMLMPLANFMQTPMYGVKNYHIEIVATSEDQAIDTFSVVHDMLEENRSVMKKMFYWNKTMVVNKMTGSILRYNTSNAGTKDGKRPGMVIFNELHAYEDYEQLNVFTSSFGKVKHARIWSITTDGLIRGGPLDEKKDIAMQILHGEPNLMGMFPFLARRRDDEGLDESMKEFIETGDRNTIDWSFWKQSNPSLEYMPNLQTALRDDYVRLQDTPSYKKEFYPKRLNLPMQDDELVAIHWDKILEASYKDVEKKIERDTPELEGKTAVVGIDYAEINDFLSAGFLFKVDNEYIWRQKTWICSQSRFFNEIKFPFGNAGQKGFQDFEVVDTETIDERLMIDWIIENMQKYNVAKIVMDNYRFRLIRKSFLEEGLTAETKEEPHGLISMIRNVNPTYAEISPKIEKEFIEGNINIGDSAIMRWAINNTKLKPYRGGLNVYDKIERKLRKNDPFMAFVHAFSRYELLDEEANETIVII